MYKDIFLSAFKQKSQEIGLLLHALLPISLNIYATVNRDIEPILLNHMLYQCKTNYAKLFKNPSSQSRDTEQTRNTANICLTCDFQQTLLQRALCTSAHSTNKYLFKETNLSA